MVTSKTTSLRDIEKEIDKFSNLASSNALFQRASNESLENLIESYLVVAFSKKEAMDYSSAKSMLDLLCFLRRGNLIAELVPHTLELAGGEAKKLYSVMETAYTACLLVKNEHKALIKDAAVAAVADLHGEEYSAKLLDHLANANMKFDRF